MVANISVDVVWVAVNAADGTTHGSNTDTCKHTIIISLSLLVNLRQAAE